MEPSTIVPTASHEKKILQLLDLMNLNLDIRIGEEVNQFRQSFQDGLGADLPPNVQEALAVIERALRAGQDNLLRDIVSVYARHFTEAEVDDLLAFHASPTGRHFQAAGEAVQNDAFDVKSAWSTAAMRSVEGDLARLLGVAPPPITNVAAPTSPAPLTAEEIFSDA